MIFFSQIKSSLMTNSSLTRIVDGFDSVERSTASRALQSNVATKLLTFTGDPLINDPLKHLTAFAGSLLKNESSLSLSYTCSAVTNQENTFKISHKDFPLKHRTVCVTPDNPSETFCSCRKTTWHGIVCRHILCAFRHINQMSCPIELFSKRWTRDYIGQSRQGISVDLAFGPGIAQPSRSQGGGTMSTEDERIGELSAMSKSLILRCASSEIQFNMLKSMLMAAGEAVDKSLNVSQSRQEDDLPIRNPLKVRSKGRPKTGNKRYTSQADKQRSKRKRA